MMDQSTVFVRRIGLVAGALLLGACTIMPTGPSVMVLPGTGQGMDRFRSDDYVCRDFAFGQIGGKSAQRAANEAAIGSAAVGTVIGAVAGAAIGGNQGAAVGAGAGLLMGGAVGGDRARVSGYGSQRQYDNAYIQCMYGRGHKVPVSAEFAKNLSQSPAAPARSGNYPPPPSSEPPPDYVPR